MKIRTGFVSNSSTSSFVIIGFNLGSDGDITYEYIYTRITGKTSEEITKAMKESKHAWYRDGTKDQNDRDEYVREELWHEINFGVQMGIDSGVGNKVVIGKTIASAGSEGDYFDDIEIDFDEMRKELEPLKQKFDKDLELKIFVGTQNC